ncbi:hypothetical protein GB928_004255 [Shinella curvata]|uniref:Uncharacterized protein n=1 Tax=Shinella curvata TaxID=1817964 RepID=A0ABT8X9H7_9HYPH|nr:hypothetical protein [Shinella curvata]MCJ8051664.1 hypothetical protein [Shinella curvata]MDO6120388.1 hypothetical protein [Shinella curvata]
MPTPSVNIRQQKNPARLKRVSLAPSQGYFCLKYAMFKTFDSVRDQNTMRTMNTTEADWLSYAGLLGSDVTTFGTLLPDLQLGVFCQSCSRTIPIDREELTAKHGARQDKVGMKQRLR